MNVSARIHAHYLDHTLHHNVTSLAPSDPENRFNKNVGFLNMCMMVEFKEIQCYMKTSSSLKILQS